MRIRVYDGKYHANPQTFEDIEGITFYSGIDNNTGKAVAEWTRVNGYGSYGEELLLNIDPTMCNLRSMYVDDDETFIFIN